MEILKRESLFNAHVISPSSRIVFDDFTYTECPDGAFVDDNQEHTLECYNPGANATVPVKVRRDRDRHHH